MSSKSGSGEWGAPSRWMARPWSPPEGLKWDSRLDAVVEALRHPVNSAESYDRFAKAMDKAHSPYLDAFLPPEIHQVEMARALEAAVWRLWEKIGMAQGVFQEENVVALHVHCPCEKSVGWVRSRFQIQVATRDEKTGKVGYSDTSWPYAPQDPSSSTRAQDLFWSPLPTFRLLNLLGGLQKVVSGGSIQLEVPRATSWDAISMAVFGTTPLAASMDIALPNPSYAPKPSRF